MKVKLQVPCKVSNMQRLCLDCVLKLMHSLIHQRERNEKLRVHEICTKPNLWLFKETRSTLLCLQISSAITQL